jgi:hypothetical protein
VLGSAAVQPPTITPTAVFAATAGYDTSSACPITSVSSSWSSAFGLAPDAPGEFMKNNEMTDTMFEKEGSLIKDLPPRRMSAINKFTHISKPYSNANLKVVHHFFEILANDQDEELRSLARKRDNGNLKDQFT